MADRSSALAGAAVAFMAAQGFGRFGFALILPSMRDGLGLSNGEMGILAGVALAAYLLLAIPAGALATRFGTRRVVVGGLLGTAVGLAATGLAGGFSSALGAQVVVGAASPMVIVPLLAIGPAWSEPEYRGRATGLVVGGGGLGLLAAGVLVPPLLGPEDAWRHAWWGLALATLASALVAALLVHDPPGTRQVARPSLAAAYRSAAVWQIGLLFLLYGVAYTVYGTFFAAHLAQRRLDAAAAGHLWSLAGAVSIGSGLLGGALADRLGAATALTLMFATQGIGLALLALGDGVTPYVGSAVLYGASAWAFPSAISKACVEAVGPALAPAALGLAALLFSVGMVAGPLAGGPLADLTGSFAPALLLGAAADLTGALGAFLLARSRPSGPA